MRAPALVISLIAGMSGCHLVFPFDLDDGEVTSPDAARLDAVVDAAWQPPDDNGLVDQQVPADNAPTAPDQQPDAGCNEPAGINLASVCHKQCVVCAGDNDGDGLMDGVQDPWPGTPATTCNKLLLAEEFATSKAPSWSSTGASWFCGRLDLGTSGNARLSDPAPLGPDPVYLTEMKLTLGPNPAAQTWSLGLRTAYDKKATETHGHIRRCVLQRALKYSIYRVGVALKVYVSDSSGASTYDQKSNIAAPNGAVFLLQTWTTGGFHWCRLLDGAGTTVVSTAQFQIGSQNLNRPGTIEVFAAGRSFSADYVRVFKHAP